MSPFGKDFAIKSLGEEKYGTILRWVGRGASLEKTSPRGKLKRFRVLHVGGGVFTIIWMTMCVFLDSKFGDIIFLEISLVGGVH